MGSQIPLILRAEGGYPIRHRNLYCFAPILKSVSPRVKAPWIPIIGSTEHINEPMSLTSASPGSQELCRRSHCTGSYIPTVDLCSFGTFSPTMNSPHKSPADIYSFSVSTKIPLSFMLVCNGGINWPDSKLPALFSVRWQCNAIPLLMCVQGH